MKTLTIGNQNLNIKDYYCDGGEGYLHRDDGKLWLYVNITDICNAHCPFCINPCFNHGRNPFDIDSFEGALTSIKDSIYGVSITGGEPMLFPELVDEVTDKVNRVFDGHMEIDLVTNGFCFPDTLQLRNLESLDSIHLSRHRIEDEENSRVFGIPVVKSSEIRGVICSLSDPAKVVFNCVLMKNGIDCTEKMAAYLEYASETGVRNTSFIGMAKSNAFCEENYIDPGNLLLTIDQRFTIWNAFCDHEYCRCSSGSYKAKKGNVRFYYRCIGSKRAPYVRQLVYTADNKLLGGFGGKEIKLF